MSATVSDDVLNNIQFCTMFDLTHIVKPPTRITCFSTPLIDYELASVPERNYKQGLKNGGLLFHQLIYCTRKISRIKTRGVHKKKNFI